jgi:hypothetical protein
MSELDRLTYGSVSGVPMRPKARVSVSGVPMRPKVKITPEQAALQQVSAEVADLAKRISTPAERRKVRFSMTRGLDGNLDRGTVTNGASSWELVFTRSEGGLTVEVSPT